MNIGWTRSWVALLSILLIGSSFAQPTPFKASYSANIDLLIDVPVTATRELLKTSSGTWRFTNRASAFMAKQSETSELKFDQGKWSPLLYNYERSLFGRSRSISIDFDEAGGRITTLVNGDPWNQRWESAVQDRLSYQLQLREDLKSGRQSLHYRIADGGQIKDYQFTRLGEELLKTPAGTFRCEKLQLVREGQQHTTLIWMAKELDYLTIRLIRIDADGKEHLLNLKDVEFYD